MFRRKWNKIHKKVFGGKCLEFLKNSQDFFSRFNHEKTKSASSKINVFSLEKCSFFILFHTLNKFSWKGICSIGFTHDKKGYFFHFVSRKTFFNRYFWISLLNFFHFVSHKKRKCIFPEKKKKSLSEVFLRMFNVFSPKNDFFSPSITQTNLLPEYIFPFSFKVSICFLCKTF